MKKAEDVWVDEQKNFEENYREDILRDPSRFDRIIKKLQKIFGIAMPIITAATMSTVMVACKPDTPTPPKPAHTHRLLKVNAVKESCTQDGMKAHWECSDCDKLFSDSQGKNEVQKADLVVKAHHTLTHKTEQKATCTADGNIDYYHCSACGENFLDANGKNKVDLDDTVIASKGHVVGDEWQHDENGHWKVCGACHEQVDYHAHNFEDFVCTDCGAVDEQNKPLTEEEITLKITDALEENILNLIRPDSIVNYLALNSAIVDGQYKVQILVDYLSSMSGKEEEYLSLVELPITQEFTPENVKNGLCLPTAKRTGKKLITFKKATEDERGVEILKKIDPEGDHDHYDFVSVKIGTGSVTQDSYLIYTINRFGIKAQCVNADSFGVRDVVETSILNGTEGQTYELNHKADENYEFSDNVIYNFNGLLNKTEEKAYDILLDGRKVGMAQGNVMFYEVDL